MDQQQLDYFRTLLSTMLEEALDKGDETLEDMGEAGHEVFADPSDRATAESDRSFTLRLRDRELKLIKKIRSAQRRMEEGAYGQCDDCGEDISIERLKARPVTKLCIHCKSRQEQKEKERGD